MEKNHDNVFLFLSLLSYRALIFRPLGLLAKDLCLIHFSIFSENEGNNNG